jgi:hypothetical protein
MSISVSVMGVMEVLINLLLVRNAQHLRAFADPAAAWH